MIPFRDDPGQAGPWHPLLVFGTDGASPKIDGDRYRIFVNGDYLGDYAAHGHDLASQAIERRMVRSGTIPSELRVVGNSIHILCQDDLAPRVVCELKVFFGSG